MKFLTMQSSPILFCLFPPRRIYVPVMQLQVWASATNVSTLKKLTVLPTLSQRPLICGSRNYRRKISNIPL